MVDPRLLKWIEHSVFKYANGFVEDFDVRIFHRENLAYSRKIKILPDRPSLSSLSELIEDASARLRSDGCEDLLDILLYKIESEVRSLSGYDSFSLSGWKSELRDILKG